MRPRGVIVIAVATLVTTLSSARKQTLVLPRPSPQLREEATPHGAADRNASCEHCHQEIASEWRASRHSVSYTNPELARVMGREHESLRGFCKSCHAPESARHAVSKSSDDLGVGCVTCHVPLGPVLAAPNTDSPTKKKPPHALLRTTSFTNGDACASCHEFAFPDTQDGAQMQRTLSEHRGAAGSDLGCNGCHMPVVGSGKNAHRSHAFRGGHDADFVRSALEVSASRPDASSVAISVSPVNVTHAVPTGDLFRRLTVSVETASGERRTRHLARHFESRAGRLVEVSDDRPYRKPERVVFNLSEDSASGPIRWSVTYDRVLHVGAGAENEADAVLSGQIAIAEGTLPAP